MWYVSDSQIHFPRLLKHKQLFAYSYSYCFYRHILSSSSAEQTVWGGERKSLPFLQAHNWKMSWDLVAFAEGMAVGRRGIRTVLDSSLISPATDSILMSFRDMALMWPALDSMLMPPGARISKVLVADSNLWWKRALAYFQKIRLAL